MNEQTKKAEKIEQEVKPAELSEQELDKVAGGGGGIGTVGAVAGQSSVGGTKTVAKSGTPVAPVAVAPPGMGI